MRTLGLILATLVALGVEAHAQEAWRVPVAVLDFHDLSDYRGHLLDRRAADALFVALQTSGRWQMVDRRTVRAQCEKLGLEPPFAVGHLQQVAYLTGAHLAASGVVQQCSADAAGKVKLTLRTEVIDLVSGEPTASATVVGTAAPAEGQSLDSTVERALESAAQQATKRLLDFPPQQVTVHARVGDKLVLLEVGSQAGVVPGVRFLLYPTDSAGRPTGSPVALVRVQSVQPASAECTVVTAREPVTVQDVAVAVGRD